MINLTRDWRSRELPEPFAGFMEKWEHNAAEAMKTYEFRWPAKLLETMFTYEGKKYSISPAAFDIPDDLCERFQRGPWVTGNFGGGFDDDLKAIPGVTGVLSFGYKCQHDG